MTFLATESFTFGDIQLSCVSSPSLDRTLVVQRVAITPALPEGMVVDLVAVYRIELALHAPIHNFAFDFTFIQSKAKGDPNSGEYLEAQSWPIGNGLLMFGTEDGEMLQARMPWLKIQGDDYPVEYLTNGFRVVIPYIPPEAKVGFHFVLAFNHKDDGCCSEWFAVDIPHARLADSPVLKHLSGEIAG